MSGRFRPVPWWLRVVAVAIGVLILLIGGLWAFQRRLIYQVEPAAPGPAADVLDSGQDVTLHTTDGLTLAAWYLPAQSGCRSTVLVAPGNAGNRAGRAPLARALADRGLGVFLLEYRGYGGNPGRPDEAGLLADATAAYRYLTAARSAADRSMGSPPEPAQPAPNLIYFGESLGAAVLTSLAAHHPPSALVLRSPFTDLPAAAGVAFPFLPVRRMLWDQWPLAEELSRITVPTTIIYGTADTVIPPDLSLAVADAAGGPATLIAVPGANHNDRELLDGPAVIDAVLAAEQPTC